MWTIHFLGRHEHLDPLFFFGSEFHVYFKSTFWIFRVEIKKSYNPYPLFLFFEFGDRLCTGSLKLNESYRRVMRSPSADSKFILSALKFLGVLKFLSCAQNMLGTLKWANLCSMSMPKRFKYTQKYFWVSRWTRHEFL